VKQERKDAGPEQKSKAKRKNLQILKTLRKNGRKKDFGAAH